MINRRQVENILKINGVTPTSADQEIRSVLLSARYNKDEVDSAIMVLRQNVKTNETTVEGLHKVFRTDLALKPSEVSDLLGVQIDVSEKVSVSRNIQGFSLFQLLIIWVLSVLLALLGILMLMYQYKIGFFHSSVV
jgi:hypothetical protein